MSMERLTKIIKDDPINVLTICQARVGDASVWKEWSVSKGSAIEEALFRLAAYEDTGLMPDEVKQKMSGWISVNDRLPEIECNVLVMHTFSEIDRYAKITIGHLHQPSDFRYKPYWNFIAYGQDMVHPKIEAYHRAEFICPGCNYVTHWMPLPKPPEVEPCEK